ncbi:hypothetical protein DPMN_180181 [Dreissena polymorpha]|uniref:Uncharacterized protein n=1 Tax=Dreissena polymorpha TaxID=45954 RepID=A0A9D4EFF7_DREPO|nr:hypothetical protein DPMN_180181 [Dreissena polymorpha]
MVVKTARRQDQTRVKWVRLLAVPRRCGPELSPLLTAWMEWRSHSPNSHQTMVGLVVYLTLFHSEAK